MNHEFSAILPRPGPASGAGGGAGGGDRALHRSELDRAREFLVERFGFWIRDAWLDQLQTRILARMDASGTGQFEAYWSRLQFAAGRHGEAQKLAEELCIHETHFNRTSGHFDMLRAQVLPALSKGRPGKKIRLASLACSTGEEAYTLAMTACEALSGADSNVVEVSGLDLSLHALDAAREARYGEFQLRDLHPARRDRWFIREEKLWSPKPELRRLVRFHQHNLVEPLPMAGLDVIFCRNVLIYFRPELVRRLIEEFHAALNPGGWLFLGHADSIHDCAGLFRGSYTKDAAYYQRQPALSPALATSKHLAPFFE